MTSKTDLLVTEELYARSPHAPDLQAEVDAFRELSNALAFAPQSAVQRFAEIALRLCRAGSAGVSELETENGEPVFRWTALAGRFAPHVGGTTPRHFSPCGLCLDQGRTILVSRPARVFAYFDGVPDPIVEGLIVPVYDLGRVPLGTIWIVSHDERRFDPTDARIIEQLAIQLFLAIKTRKEAERLKREELMGREIGHRVGNSLQLAAHLLMSDARSSAAPEIREKLELAAKRVVAIGRIHHLLNPIAGGERIGFVSYLKSLCEAIGQSLEHDAVVPSVQVDGEEAYLPTDQLVPLGIIVNELVTNSAKHGRASDVRVRIRSDGRAHTISVRDDGAGLPAGFDPSRTRGLGMKIVVTLVKQINGTLRIGPAPGGRGSEFLVAVPNLSAGDGRDSDDSLGVASPAFDTPSAHSRAAAAPATE